MAGIQAFDEGEILIGGVSLQADPLRCKRQMAYIPDNPDLYEFMTGIQYLNFIADVFAVEADVRQERIRKYAELFELTGDLGQPIAAYSHGMKQKLAIISAWIHEPKLILMDEPFVGLDPKASHLLKGMEAGVNTVEDAQRVSDEVSEEVEKLSELKSAEAVVMGTIAVVGVEYDAQYQEGMTDRLKEMIEARVQAVDKSIVTVHVKDSESDYQKLMELREKLSNQDLTFEQLQTQVLNLAGNGQDTAVG